MQLIVKNNGEEIELDGVIRGIKNKFYVEIRVPKENIISKEKLH